MKNNNGLSNILVISISIFILAIGGYFGYRYFRKPSHEIQNNTNEICIEFPKLSEIVANTIQKSEQQVLNEEVILIPNDNPYNINYFYQFKDKGPLLVYPIKIGSYFTFQSYKNTYKTSKDLKSLFNLNSKSLTENINKEATKLGLEVDGINSVSFKKSGNNLRQKFAFTKGRSVYSIELKFKDSTQAIPEHDVEVTCGTVLHEYDSIYDSIVKSALNNWKEDEYLRVIEISEDRKVVAIQNSYLDTSSMSGSKGTLGTIFLKYYILEAGSYKPLTVAESNFADCKFLENLKIGKGMNCMRKEKTDDIPSFSKVTYE